MSEMSLETFLSSYVFHFTSGWAWVSKAFKRPLVIKELVLITLWNFLSLKLIKGKKNYKTLSCLIVFVHGESAHIVLRFSDVRIMMQTSKKKEKKILCLRNIAATFGKILAKPSILIDEFLNFAYQISTVIRFVWKLDTFVECFGRRFPIRMI